MLQKATILVFVVASIAGCIGCGSTSSHYVYAAIPAANQIIAYREDPNSGVLTQISGSPYSVGVGVHSLALHPSGKFLYAANPGQNENDISLFTINANGGFLTEVTPRTSLGNTASLPQVLAMDPAGAFLYVMNVGSSNISVFSIDSGSGALTLTGTPAYIGLPLLNMQLTPSGNFLYVSTVGLLNGEILCYSTTGGVLQFASEISSDGTNPNGLAIDPTSTYLYVANSGSPSIAAFSIGSSGSLTELTTPFSDGFSTPIALTFDPTGKFLYVANNGSNNVEVYTIANGLPTALTTSTTANFYSTESSPAVLAEDPNGKYLFVGNQGNSAGVQSFSISSSSTTLIPVFTYGVGNTPSSIVVFE